MRIPATLFLRQKIGDCFHCHFSSPLLTTNLFSNNALDSALSVAEFRDKGRGITNSSLDMGRFKVPSLINITLTAPYMHDGRYSTLRQVIQFL
jgi:cytochrome c peroxidase